MIRVLQIHDQQADFQTSRALEQLSGGLGKEFDVQRQTIGSGGNHHNVFTAAWRLRTIARQADITHAWGTRALSAAAFAGISRILLTPTNFPSGSQIRWIRAVAAHRSLEVISPTATIRRRLIESGLPVDQVHLVRPGVDFARIRRRRDTQLRATLGLDDQHQVLLACGESTSAANHRLATWAAAILNVLDKRTRLLIWGRGPQSRSAAQFGRKLGQPELLIDATQALGRPIDFEELLPAADMALVTASAPLSVLPIAICMAGAMPIVATVTPTVAELLEDRHTALMVPPDVPRLVAQKIVSLREDSNLAWSISDMARTEAYEFFPLTRFLAQHRELYRQAAAGSKLQLAQTPAGAGLRFHGRA